ncbi:MAG: polyketide cyclase, partial [Alphaproteobacteria bacterium]
WRMENGLIRENWVLIDMLDIYRQLGIDVLGRLAEFNKARNLGRVDLSDGMEMVEKRT